MGRVAGSYGVRGWLKVIPGGGVVQALAAAREWWIGATRRRGARAATLSDSWIPPSISRSGWNIPFLPAGIVAPRGLAPGPKTRTFPV